MKFKYISFAVSLLPLAACDPSVDPNLVSDVPASQTSLTVAQRATSICSRTAPDFAKTVTELAANGFTETPNSIYAPSRSGQRGRLFENSAAGVTVLVGTSGREMACIVGLASMTSQQSFDLALPWVRRYDALTNEERGQGLAKNVVQAWAIFEENRNIYIAAYKTWEPLEEPGAAVRLIYRPK